MTAGQANAVSPEDRSSPPIAANDEPDTASADKLNREIKAIQLAQSAQPAQSAVGQPGNGLSGTFVPYQAVSTGLPIGVPMNLITAQPASQLRNSAQTLPQDQPSLAGRLRQGLTFGNDENMQPAFSEGVFGTRNTVTSDAISLRAAKLVQLGASHAAKIYEQYPGGPVTVELFNSVDASIGRGRSVEENWFDTRKHLPGQPKEDRPLTSTFYEGIFRTHQARYARGREYTFPDAASAEQFLNGFQQQTSLVSQYMPEFGIQSEFDSAYRAYTAAQGAEAGASGGHHSLMYSPGAGKLYGSATFGGFKDVLDSRAPGLSDQISRGITRVAPGVPEWVPQVLANGVGVYGEIGGSVEGGFTYSFDDTTRTHYIDQTDDLDTGAPGSILAQGRIDYRAFGALSVGNWAPIAGLHEGAFLGGTGAVLERNSWVPPQWVAMAEWHGGHLDPNASQFFRDVRINRFPGIEGPHASGAQALTGQLEIDREMSKIELRWDIWGTPVETLTSVYRSEIENAGAHKRIEAVKAADPSSPFLVQRWEQNARHAYETQVNKGALSDEDWNSVLHDALDWSFDDSVYSLFNGDYRAWADTHITDAHVASYAQWDGIGAQRIANREAQLQQMEPAELYEAYREAGLRYPGVYIGIYEGDKTEVLGGGGVSVTNPRRPSRKDDLNNPFGLYQAKHTSQNETYNQVGSLAASHEAWPRMTEIVSDPVAGPAYVALMNRHAYPRVDAAGKPVQPSPQAVLMYHGVTPTHQIEALQTATGHRRDLSNIPGVYKVSAGERTFDGIGAQALRHFLGRAVSPAEAHAYGERIKDLNFRGMADPESQIFENAMIILPAPPPDPRSIFIRP